MSSPASWSRRSRRNRRRTSTRTEVAGPGFVNFHLAPTWLHDVLTEVVAKGEADYARLDFGAGERVQVEFVSANPTGPIHVGNGWFASYGDSLARLLTGAATRPAASTT